MPKQLFNLTKASLKCLLMMALFFLHSTLFALESDKHALMQVSADTADLNQLTHFGVYKGNVEVNQGSTHLRANKAFTQSDKNNKLKFAKAFGDHAIPAHFWTETDEKKPPLHAWALEIRYFPEKHLIVLLGNARVEQGEDSLSAPKITYHTEKKLVTSHGDKNTRPVIIFHPEKKS